MIRTSRPTTSTADRSGFTLVELLVVVALIGLMGYFVLPSVNSLFKLSLQSATREIASVVREAYNSTAMTGKVHRLVMDQKEHQYWVEVGLSDVLLDTSESLEKERRRRRFGQSEEKAKESPFQIARAVTRKKKSLPRGVEFEDVVTEQSAEPITGKTAYAHFFPHGITERTVIHLKDGQNHQVTLSISPILGRTRLIERYVKPEEVDAPR